MVHPAALLLPIMMLADYYLTVLSAALAERKYRQHYRIQHHELNPLWQRDVASKRWLNPRHLALTALISTAILVPIEFCGLPESFVQAALGCLFTAFGVVLGRHLSNLLIFRHVIRTPREISGEVSMSHSLVLAVSAYQHLGVLPLLVLIAVFTASWFAYGGVLGILALVAVHSLWLRGTRRHKPGPGPRPEPAG